MALSPVSVQQITEVGLAATYATPNTTDTYQIPNDGRTFLHVKKSGAGSCNVTINTPGTVGPGSLAIAEDIIAVPATTGDRFIGPLPPGVYNDSGGLLNVTFSEVTGLTFAALRL